MTENAVKESESRQHVPGEYGDACRGDHISSTKEYHLEVPLDAIERCLRCRMESRGPGLERAAVHGDQETFLCLVRAGEFVAALEFIQGNRRLNWLFVLLDRIFSRRSHGDKHVVGPETGRVIPFAARAGVVDRQAELLALFKAGEFVKAMELVHGNSRLSWFYALLDKLLPRLFRGGRNGAPRG